MNDTNEFTTTNQINPDTKKDRAKPRAAINRQNATKSTGPRTPAGKRKSSLNATRHGLTGQVIVLPTEDLNQYHLFSQRFFDDYQPKGAIEQQLLLTIIDCSWKLNRTKAWEDVALSIGFDEVRETTDPRNHPSLRDALATTCVAHRIAKDIANYSLYGQRTYRMFAQAEKRLHELQTERKQREQSELNDAIRLYELHQFEEAEKQQEAVAKKLPKPPLTVYNPKDSGFVYSSDEMETLVRRRSRLDQARSLPRSRPAAA